MLLNTSLSIGQKLERAYSLGYWTRVASYPGFEKGEEKHLVHTVCTCTNFKLINYIMAYSDDKGGWLA